MLNEFWWADFIRRNDQDSDGPPLLFVTIRIEHPNHNDIDVFELYDFEFLTPPDLGAGLR